MTMEVDGIGTEGAGGGGVDLGGGAGGAAAMPPDALNAADPQGAVNPADMPPPFTPNLNLKVYDKEYEIPERFRALIKDKESEKEVREVFEKAYGIDFVKSNRDSLRSENAQLKSWREQAEGTFQHLGNLAADGRPEALTTLFSNLGLTRDKILRYALNIAEKTPEQLAAFDAQMAQNAALTERERTLAAMGAQNEELSVRIREIELGQYLSRPELAPIVQSFNAGKDNPDAFQSFVVMIGQAHYAKTGEDLPVETAVQQAISYLGAQATQPPAVSTPQAHAAGNPHNVVPKPTKETLPNISGSSKTPVKSQIKNFEDLKRATAEL